MTYDKLLETAGEILTNNKIYTTGLRLVYELSPKKHKQMNEDLFYKQNTPDKIFVATEDFEVNIEGLVISFIYKKD